MEDTRGDDRWSVPQERMEAPEGRLMVLLVSPPRWIRRLSSIASARHLDTNDIFRIPSSFATRRALAEYREKHKLSANGPRAQLACFGLVFAKDIALTFFLCLFVVAETLILPLVVRLSLVELQAMQSNFKIFGLVLLFLTFLVLGRLTNSLLRHFFATKLEMARSLLTTIIYDKALRLSSLEYKHYDDLQITVLMLNDVERFMYPWYTFEALLSIITMLPAAMAFQYDVLGSAAFVYIAGVVLFTIMFSVLVMIMTNVRYPALQAADYRTGLLRELLKNIHVVKFYGWERPMALLVDAYRQQEQKSLRLFHILNSLSAVCRPMLGPICSSAAFILYVHGNQRLTADRAFSSLLLGPIMFQSVGAATDIFSGFINWIKSVQRINEFLDAREQENLFGELPSSGRFMFKVRNCTVSWPSLTVIQNLNAKLAKGSLIIVAGPVGSGKTTMLLAFQGMAHQTPKAIRISKGARVSSVMRNWAQWGTVRDNILFGLEWDAQKYDWAVEFCRLRLDFSTLPDGDLTEIGDGGVTLSGGQRTRISLARCLYMDPDVYILDDVLSSVDGLVARQIFQNLRQLAAGTKTVIISSNDYKILPAADKVLFLDGKGGYLYGSYDKLLQKGHFFDAMQTTVTTPGLEKDSDDASVQACVSAAAQAPGFDSCAGLAHAGDQICPNFSVPCRGAGEEPHEASSFDSFHGVQYSPCSSERISDGRARPALFALVGEEDKELDTTVQKIGAIWRLMRISSSSPIRMIVNFVFLFASQSLLTAFPLIVLELLVSAKSVREQEKLKYLLSAGTATQVAFLLVTYIVKDLALDLVVRRIHQIAALNLFRAPMSYFESVPMGRSMARFTLDLEEINSTLRAFMPRAVVLIAEMVAYIALATWLEPVFGIPLTLFMLVRILQWKISPVVFETQRVQRIYDSAVISAIMEGLNGLSVLVGYGQQERALNNITTALDDQQMSSFASLYMKRNMKWISLGNAVPFLALRFLGMILFHRSPNPAAFGLLMFVLERFYLSSNELLDTMGHLTACSCSAVRLAQLVWDLPAEQYTMPGKQPRSQRWVAKEGAIEFQNAYFQYRRQLPFVLNDFSLSVKGGEKVGICGRTGAGKSTIFNALFRFSELRRGRILIDGQDISQIGVSELRNSLAVIPQQTVLFRGTIRSNLDPNDELEDDVLWNALQRSGFCEATTRRLALDLKVEAEGSNFSLGERQLISLARALVRRCKIILLDEATAAVDYASDRLIQRAIQREFDACTVLCVAHRIQTIVRYDKILALGMGGQRLEFGEPRKLYARRGLFWEMCEDAGVEEADLGIIA